MRGNRILRELSYQVLSNIMNHWEREEEIIICDQCRGKGEEGRYQEETVCSKCEGSGKLKKTTIIETFQSKVEEAIQIMTHDKKKDAQFEYMKEKRIGDYRHLYLEFQKQKQELEKRIEELENEILHSKKI